MTTDSNGPFPYRPFSTKWHRDPCRMPGLKARAALYEVSLGHLVMPECKRVMAKEHRCQFMKRLRQAKNGTTKHQKEQ